MSASANLYAVSPPAFPRQVHPWRRQSAYLGGRRAQKLMHGSWRRGTATPGCAEAARSAWSMTARKGSGGAGAGPRGRGTTCVSGAGELQQSEAKPARQACGHGRSSMDVTWMCLWGWLAPDCSPQLKNARPPPGRACTMQALARCSGGQTEQLCTTSAEHAYATSAGSCLQDFQCGCQVCSCQAVQLGLESPGHDQQMVLHHVELVEQQRVRVRQVADPQVLAVGQEGVGRLGALCAADHRLSTWTPGPASQRKGCAALSTYPAWGFGLLCSEAASLITKVMPPSCLAWICVSILLAAPDSCAAVYDCFTRDHS